MDDLRVTTVFLLITSLDLVDAGFDYALAVNLIDNGFKREAIWLSIQTTLTLIVELTIKVKLHKQKRDAIRDGGVLDTEQGGGFTMYLLCATSIEVSIFLLEDTTTVLIWWLTGTYDRSFVSTANLVTTTLSAIVVGVGLIVAMFRMGHLSINTLTKNMGFPERSEAKNAAKNVKANRNFIRSIAAISLCTVSYWTYISNVIISDENWRGNGSSDGKWFLVAMITIYASGYLLALCGLYYPSKVAFKLYDNMLPKANIVITQSEEVLEGNEEVDFGFEKSISAMAPEYLATLNTTRFEYNSDEFPPVVILYATRSLGHTGRDWMWALANSLRTHGIRSFNGNQVFGPAGHGSAGNSWLHEVIGMIAECKVVVAMTSSAFFESAACLNELCHAAKSQRDSRVVLLPITVDGTYIDTYMPSQPVAPEHNERLTFLRTQLSGNVIPPRDRGTFLGNSAKDFEKNVVDLVTAIRLHI